jgi:hypothetical protein
MLVKTLISELKRCNPNAEAVIEGGEYDDVSEQFNRDWVRSVQYDDDKEGNPNDRIVVIS